MSSTMLPVGVQRDARHATTPSLPVPASAELADVVKDLTKPAPPPEKATPPAAETRPRSSTWFDQD